MAKVLLHYFEEDFEIQAITSVGLCMHTGAGFIAHDHFSRPQELEKCNERYFSYLMVTHLIFIYILFSPFVGEVSQEVHAHDICTR